MLITEFAYTLVQIDRGFAKNKRGFHEVYVGLNKIYSSATEKLSSSEKSLLQELDAGRKAYDSTVPAISDKAREELVRLFGVAYNNLLKLEGFVGRFGMLDEEELKTHKASLLNFFRGVNVRMQNGDGVWNDQLFTALEMIVAIRATEGESLEDIPGLSYGREFHVNTNVQSMESLIQYWRKTLTGQVEVFSPVNSIAEILVKTNYTEFYANPESVLRNFVKLKDLLPEENLDSLCLQTLEDLRDALGSMENLPVASWPQVFATLDEVKSGLLRKNWVGTGQGSEAFPKEWNKLLDWTAENPSSPQDEVEGVSESILEGTLLPMLKVNLILGGELQPELQRQLAFNYPAHFKTKISNKLLQQDITMLYARSYKADFSDGAISGESLNKSNNF